MSQVASLVCFCLMGTCLYFVIRERALRRSSLLPPGPSGWPVIGNLFEISSKRACYDFTALGQKYGDILTVTMLGTRHVVLNSAKTVLEILDKQGRKSADRPHLTMVSDLVGLGKVTSFMDYNDQLRHHRKLSHGLFGTKGNTAAFSPIIEEETRRFLGHLLRNPDDLAHHIRITAGAVILKVIYGYTVQEEKDPFVKLADELVSLTALAAMPGAFLVDLIPVLRYLPEWFPGAGFLQIGKRFRQLATEAVLQPHAYVVEQMAAGTATPSFLSKHLEGGVSTEEEDVITWTAMSLYLGGSDTVVAAIHAFFLAMELFPDVQAKAQVELDAVVSTTRLPTFDDRDSLPYINAVCKEVLRWHTVAPLALTHVATEDIYYDGFLIPKGAHIVGNAWAILHDESTYPDPHTFRPERFLGEKPQPDPQNVCFGFGRRKCPGFHLAEASLFVSVAMSLAVLHISKPVVDGVPVTPTVDVTPGAVCHVKPFKCQITPKSVAHAEALLRKESSAGVTRETL